MPVSTGMASLLSLPAYTTVMAQIFSPDGQLLACASDKGRLAFFKVSDLVSEGRKGGEDNLKKEFEESGSCFFHFSLDDSCFNCLASTKDFLIAGVRQGSSQASIMAWAWRDVAQKKVKLAWCIDASSGLLPSDINSLAVDDGVLIVGGGGGDFSNDFAIRMVELETRMAARKPLDGHTDYLHSVDVSQQHIVASAGEDGSARTWDARVKKPCTATLWPCKEAQLARPNLGQWLGDVSIQGDWLVTGGGPKAALWHLRAQAPTAIPELPPTAEEGSYHVTRMILPDRIVLGGQLGMMKSASAAGRGRLYQTNMQGQIVAEIDTCATCIYSVVSNTTQQQQQEQPLNVMAVAGSSSKIDLATHNLSYRDKTVTFPTL